MNYPSPAYGAAPAAAATSASTGKIIAIVVAVIVVGTVLFLGAVAIALGVGLGIGLRQSSSSSTSSSSISAPTVSCNSSTATCGCPVNTPTFSSRLISGTTARTNSWPWLVLLSINNNRTCTGFLITYRDVVTSANCVYGVNVTNILAFIGTTTITNKYSGIVSNVSNYNYPSNYSINSNIADVAVLRLSSNITVNTSTISTCCITSNTSLPILGESAVVAGWGGTSATSTSSDTAQQAVVQVMDPSTCGVSSTSDRQFCADYGFVSTCPSDLGSPLMTSVNNAWTCTGLVSGGNSTCYGVGIYTRLSYYNSFITNFTLF